MSQSNSLFSTPSPSPSSPTSSSTSPSPPADSPTPNHHPHSPSPLSQPTTDSYPPSASPSPSPPPTTTHQPSHAPSASRPRPKRPATLYDAVAGRITTSGFLTSHPNAHAHAHAHARAHAYASRHRDTASSSLVALPPEEVLFRRKRAPVRYLDGEGGDWYFADERELGGEGGSGDDWGKRLRLPASELVGAVHGYVSGFYAGVVGEGERWGGGDWRSMDETALLAVGILLEEEVRRVLGGSGDLVFVEGEGVGERVGERGKKEEGKDGERERGEEGSGRVKREKKKGKDRKGERGRKRKRRKIGGDETKEEAEGNGVGFALEESGSGG